MLIATSSFLPTQPTPLVDRTHELAMVAEQLVSGDTHLLTLTGPAGVGKTRVAVAAASQLANHFRDGVVFVDLTPVRDPELVLSNLAGAIGLLDIDKDSQNLFRRLRAVLGERQMLLVLDNFEQVLPAAAALADLLGTTASLRMLVTSRVPLQLRWERTLRIAPLTVPDLGRPLPPLDELAAIPSIALFLQWARTRQADFVLTEKQGPVVAQLAVQLDGLPLALELAAASTATLSLPAIVNRLGDRLRLLHWEASDVPKRQQSLEAAVGWSYDLLTAPEQRLFRCLGVFVQRISLDATTAVYGEMAGEASGADSSRVLDWLISLAKQSLIQPTRSADLGWHQEWFNDEANDEANDEENPEFGMLETVREYAEEQLASEGELETAHRAHAAYFLALAEQADPHLHGYAQRAWLLRLDRERDNLRMALRWLLDQDTPTDRAAALRLAGALGYFWLLRGYHTEGSRWLGEALSRAPQGERGDPDVQTRALLSAGPLSACLGELKQARAYLDEALALARQRQDSFSIVRSLIYQGMSPLLAGQDLAVPLLEEALGHTRVFGEPDHLGILLFYLGVALQAQGHTDPAAARFTEALELLEAAGDARVAGAVHVHLGALLGHQQGDWSSALHHLRIGLATSVNLQSRWLLSQIAWTVQALPGDRGDPGARAQLLGATEALRHAMGAGRPAWERMAANLGEPVLHEPLRQEERAAYQVGSVMPVGEVVALTLTLLDEFARTPSTSVPAATGSSISHLRGRAQAAQQDDESRGEHLLTGREREVLRLVGQGLSNKAIGQELFISARTVSQHLTAVFNKLGVNTRAQAVGVAAQFGLI
ncbi:MAG TPA: LuxR C-terminal-related transcriptional regulator [Ktedonobacterales bacterium]